MFKQFTTFRNLLGGTKNEVGERMLAIQLILMQRLMGEQKTVVHHIEISEESWVSFYLSGKPGFFLAYSNHNKILFACFFVPLLPNNTP